MGEVAVLKGFTLQRTAVSPVKQLVAGRRWLLVPRHFRYSNDSKPYMILKALDESYKIT